MTPEIGECAKTLIECVRDAAIESNDANLQPNAKSLAAERWKLAAQESPAGFARVVIPIPWMKSYSISFMPSMKVYSG